MRIIETMDDIREGVAGLVVLEPRFADAIALAGEPPLRRRPSGFAELLRILVGQQVSVAAADGIWRRVEEGGATTPAAILSMSDEDLRALGLSRPKARYFKTTATAVIDGTLCIDTCASAPVADAVKMLTAVTGIGPWTAEIYLMFCVGRADVFAPKDLALQEATRILFDLPERPTDKQLAMMAEAWSPWRAIAARVLFTYYHAAKGREGVTG